MTSVLAPIALVVALWLCYRCARERAEPVTAAIAVVSVAVGGPVAWHVGAPDAVFLARLLAGAVAAAVWSRATRRSSDAVSVGIGVALGLVAMLPWIDGPVAFGAVAPVDGLWSSRGGLLATSPALYVAVLGWVPLWRTHRRTALTAMLLLVAVAAFVTAHEAWWSGAWPSSSAFSVIAPYLVVGAAALIEALARLSTRHPLPIVVAGLGVLVTWNVTLMGVTRAGGHRIGEPVSFADLGARQARWLHDWIGHPPSYPANLVYAVRNDVSPAVYDVFAPTAWLAGTDRRGSVDIGGDDGVFIETGWHARETEGDRTFRWATDTATMRVPLARTDDVVVVLTLRPFDVPAATPQTLTLVVNGHAHVPMPLASGWTTVTLPMPRVHWQTGINRVALRFSRQARPVDLGQADTRWLACAIDAVTIEAR